MNRRDSFTSRELEVKLTHSTLWKESCLIAPGFKILFTPIDYKCRRRGWVEEYGVGNAEVEYRPLEEPHK